MNVSTVVLEVKRGWSGIQLKMPDGSTWWLPLMKGQGSGVYTVQFPSGIPAADLMVTCDAVDPLFGNCIATAHAVGD
jgi:hypothetical protein